MWTEQAVVRTGACGSAPLMVVVRGRGRGKRDGRFLCSRCRLTPTYLRARLHGRLASQLPVIPAPVRKHRALRRENQREAAATRDGARLQTAGHHLRPDARDRVAKAQLAVLVGAPGQGVMPFWH